MILKLYLVGAATHFLSNILMIDLTIRKKSVTRDRAGLSSVNRELSLYTNNLPMFVIWPVDIAKRFWQILKLKL
ncbi:hypothetical protein OAA09_00770 [bacterium]|nr:hypothetical protein [bacterium]